MMMRYVLILLMVLSGGAWGQSVPTNYTGLQWDQGSVVPGVCRAPGWFYKTDSQTTYICDGTGHFTLPNPTLSPTRVGFNILDYGATCTALNSGDSTAAIQATIDAASAVPYPLIIVPCSVNFSGQLRISTKNMKFVGLGASPLFSTANTYSALNYNANSAAGAFVTGFEDVYKQAVGTATRATNVVTLSGLASTTNYAVGGYLHVTGNSHFNGVDLGPISSKTPTTLVYTSAGIDEAVAGGFVDIAWDTALYQDQADGLTFEDISLSCNSSTTTATDNGLTTYATGARYFTDWRSGGITFRNVTGGHCAEWFWGVVSDINVFDNIYLVGNHHGIHLDAVSSQAQIGIKTSYANDAVVEINGANGTVFNQKWTGNNDGSPMQCPVTVYGTWAAGSAFPGATTLYSPWTENFGGYNGVPAFYCLGIQPDGTTSPVQVINTVFYSPELLESFGSPRTAALIRVDNATGTAVNYPISDTAFGWPTSVPVIHFVAASGSPTAQILYNVAISTVTDNAGLGTPQITKWSLANATNICFNATSSGTSPAFAVNSGCNTGIGSQASGTVNFIGNAANMGFWNVTGPDVRSDGAYKFHSGTNPASGAFDMALSRLSAGIVSVDTTTIGDGLGTVKATSVNITGSSFTFNGKTCTIISTVVTCT